MSSELMPSSRLRLGGSTFSFMWQEPALASMRRLLALGLNDFDVLAVPGHLWHDELSAEQRADLAVALRQDGIRVESLNLPALDINLCSCVPEVRAYGVDTYARAFALAADLDVRNVVVVPGRVSTLLAPDPARTLGWLRQSIETLLALTEAAGQRLYLELHPLTPVPDAASLGGFVRGIGSDRLLIAYDVSNAEFIGESQPDALRELAPILGQLHLSDGTRTAWRHDAIGQGSVDFAAVLRTLDEIGFTGVSILELISRDPLPEMADGIGRLQAP